ncbi:MAG: hypothetical protein AD742_06975 [Methylibium sp. NZG]|nr:MAG: hypothetical protein AD742_06975 [Methylibium sp. NZG]
MRRLSTLFVLGTAVALTACGGGLSLYIDGSDYDEFWPPSVSIAAAQTAVLAGQTVRLVAAASDESGIDSVAFYRLDNGAAVLLGGDGNAPYEWDAVAPTDGRDTLLVFARATDNAGNRADSAVVSIAIRP